MDDPRYNDGWLPVTEAEAPKSEAADVKTYNTEEKCVSEACKGVTCNLPFLCVDLWRHAECR